MQEVERNKPCAHKNDRDKVNLDLLPSEPLREVAWVLMHGASMYGRHNWRKGMHWSRYYAATMRHLLAWNDGENNDPDSGFSHLAHAACSLLFLLEFKYRKIGLDDRYNKGEEDGSEEY